jgi:Carboxypeptidase regulatory-like domain
MTILLLLLAFVNSGAQQQGAAMAVIRGRVVASDTAAPVRSATVRLTGAGTVGSFPSVTDIEGRFEIRDIPAGQFTLQVSKAGFSTMFFGPTGRTPMTFEIKAGQEIAFPDLRLPRAGVIVGRVADDLNDPIADLSVTAWRVQYLTPGQRRVSAFKSLQTNDLGEFRLYGLPPGKYYVSASRQVTQISGGAGGVAATTTGLREAPTFYPGTAVIADAIPVEVRIGEDTLGTNFQYRQSNYGRVTGTVLDSTGRPYDDAGVWLVPARTEGAWISTLQLIGLADKQGKFTIVDVSPGDYRAEVFSRSWMEKLGQGTAGMSPTGEVGSVSVTVTAGRTEELSIRTTTGFRVAGRMFLDGMQVTSTGRLSASAGAAADPGGFSSLSAPRSSPVSADGNFVLEGVHGPRIIRAAGLPPGTYLHHVLLRGQDVTDQGFDVSRGDVDGVEIHLTAKPSVVEGEVLDVTGAPVPSARLLVFAQNRQDWLWFDPRRYSPVTANAQGKFRVAGLPAGSYLVAVVREDDRDRAGDPDFIDSLRPFSTPLTLTDGGTTTVVIQLKR